MTVGYPEPGDLVKTVVDLVTAINAGGSGFDGTFTGEEINFDVTTRIYLKVNNSQTVLRLTAEDVQLSTPLNQGIQILADGGNETFLLNPGAVEITCNGGASVLNMGSDEGGQFIRLNTERLGFFGSQGSTRPTVPLVGTVTVQDIVDVLVAFGLVVQAS